MPIGSLIAFMMLSARVAQPLASLARLMEDLGEVRTATTLAASVLNQRPERDNPAPPASVPACRVRSASGKSLTPIRTARPLP